MRRRGVPRAERRFERRGDGRLGREDAAAISPLFVGQNDAVCAMLGDSLTCSTGLRLPPNAVGIATSLMHYCAWTKTGETYCAGYNKDGRVGTGARSDHEELTLVRGVPNVARVAVAARSTCAVTTDGGAWCWGDDVSLAPRRIDIDHVAGINAGAEPYCFLHDDGSVARMGYRAASPSAFGGLSEIASLAGCWPTSICGARKDGTAGCVSTGEFKKEFPITSTDVSSLHSVIQGSVDRGDGLRAPLRLDGSLLGRGERVGGRGAVRRRGVHGCPRDRRGLAPRVRAAG